jgi:hypothetical protein
MTFETHEEPKHKRSAQQPKREKSNPSTQPTRIEVAKANREKREQHGHPGATRGYANSRLKGFHPYPLKCFAKNLTTRSHASFAAAGL